MPPTAAITTSFRRARTRVPLAMAGTWEPTSTRSALQPPGSIRHVVSQVTEAQKVITLTITQRMGPSSLNGYGHKPHTARRDTLPAQMTTPEVFMRKRQKDTSIRDQFGDERRGGSSITVVSRSASSLFE